MSNTFAEVKLSLSLKEALTQVVEGENSKGEFKFYQPLKVQLKKSLFEEDFTEAHMLADLVAVKILDNYGIYFIDCHFDFKPYENHNLPLLTDSFYPNKHTENLPAKDLYNAIETQNYKPEYSVYLGNFETINDELPQFVFDTLDEYLTII